jgi:hypothetical protein
MVETKTVSKMHAGIIVALEMINNGEYTVDRETGTMFNKAGKKIGSLDKPSGSVFYVIKGVDILAHRLLYAYYHGCTINALVEEMVVKHLDGDKANNAESNLVQVPRKGQKQALEAIKTCKAVEISVARTEDNVVAPTEISGDDLIIAIWKDILAGITNAEIAEKYNVKAVKVNDIRRGKSGVKVLKKHGLV